MFRGLMKKETNILGKLQILRNSLQQYTALLDSELKKTTEGSKEAIKKTRKLCVARDILNRIARIGDDQELTSEYLLKALSEIIAFGLDNEEVCSGFRSRMKNILQEYAKFVEMPPEKTQPYYTYYAANFFPPYWPTDAHQAAAAPAAGRSGSDYAEAAAAAAPAPKTEIPVHELNTLQQKLTQYYEIIQSEYDAAKEGDKKDAKAVKYAMASLVLEELSSYTRSLYEHLDGSARPAVAPTPAEAAAGAPSSTVASEELDSPKGSTLDHEHISVDSSTLVAFIAFGLNNTEATYSSFHFRKPRMQKLLEELNQILISSDIYSHTTYDESVVSRALQKKLAELNVTFSTDGLREKYQTVVQTDPTVGASAFAFCSPVAALSPLNSTSDDKEESKSERSSFLPMQPAA